MLLVLLLLLLLFCSIKNHSDVSFQYISPSFRTYACNPALEDAVDSCNIEIPSSLQSSYSRPRMTRTTCIPPHRLFLRSLDLDGKGYFSREAAVEGLRGVVPLLQQSSEAFGCPPPSPSGQDDQV